VAKAVRAAGVDLGRFEYWSSPDARALLAGPVLAPPPAFTDAALLLGALLAAAATGRLRFGVALGRPGALPMGVGARLDFFCNISAFVTGAASGSLYGFDWVRAALAGSRLGAGLRPRFGLG
jgi:uncharacterized protein